MGSIQCGRAAFSVTGIVFTDVQKRLKVGGFRTLVRRDITSSGIIVSSIRVSPDLLRPGGPGDIGVTIARVGLARLALDGPGA